MVAWMDRAFQVKCVNFAFSTIHGCSRLASLMFLASGGPVEKCCVKLEGNGNKELKDVLGQFASVRESNGATHKTTTGHFVGLSVTMEVVHLLGEGFCEVVQPTAKITQLINVIARKATLSSQICQPVKRQLSHQDSCLQP